MRDAKRLMRKAWATAAMDSPYRPSMTFIDGKAVLSVGNVAPGVADAYADICGVPGKAKRDGNTFVWDSHADKFFAHDGPLSYMIPDYQPRQGQVQMSRIVERALQMKDIAVVNAPTGTGKSMAYLVPALELNEEKPVIISTSSKTLQSQILESDVPMLRSMYPDAKVVIMKGRSNYVCERKLEAANIPKHVEYMIPGTGLIDDLQIDIEDRQAIQMEPTTVCKGCPLYRDCRYQKHREEAKKADIIVVNHAILAIHLMNQPLLPKAAAYIIDEAHKFPNYARGALTKEVTVKGLEWLDSRMANNINCRTMPSTLDFWKAVEYAQISEDGDINAEDIEEGKELAYALTGIATELWDSDDIPADSNEAADAALAGAIRSMAERIAAVSIAPNNTFCRWAILDEHGIIEGIQMTPLEIDGYINNAIGYISEQDFRCVDCREETREPRYVINHNFICRHCRDEVEHGLEIWDGKQVDRRPNSPAWVFTSATLAVDGNAQAFCDGLGIESAMIASVATPFDYAATTMLYIASDLPEPADSTHTAKAADRAYELIESSKGGALILYASRRAMKDAAAQLTPMLQNAGLTVMVQDDLPKTEIIATMRSDPHCVTFGLASFREGVDIAGLNLRLLIIDKLFFEAPSPYSRAREAAINEWAAAQGYTGYALDFYAFNKIAVTDMILEMLQAAGRLNRRDTDRGVIAIMDPRAATKAYGRRRLLSSLPPAAQAPLELVLQYLTRLAAEVGTAEQLDLYVEDELDL